jgi:hypothetical protein
LTLTDERTGSYDCTTVNTLFRQRRSIEDPAILGSMTLLTGLLILLALAAVTGLAVLGRIAAAAGILPSRERGEARYAHRVRTVFPP